MLGTSALLDYLVCAGLGIAAVSTLGAVFFLMWRLGMTTWPASIRNLCSVLVLVAALGAQLSLAIFLGATKPLRTEGSILGFAIGSLLFGGLLLVLQAKAGRRGGTHSAGDSGTT
jgi:hypothetical protein